MAAIAKCLLILINSIFMTIGLILAAAGAILVFFPGEVLEDAYDSVKDSYPQNAPYKIPDSADDLADVPFLKTIGTGLLVFGLFLFALAFLAYAGACCTTCCRCLLILYAIIVIVFIIVEVVLGAMFYVSDSVLHDNAKDELIELCKNDYDEDGEDAFSQSMNVLHQYFDCCGIESYKDFALAGDQHPSSCEAAYKNKGCYSKLQNVIEDNIVYCGLALGVIVLLQILEVIFAIMVYKDNKVGPI